jgi:hypothetical protein
MKLPSIAALALCLSACPALAKDTGFLFNDYEVHHVHLRGIQVEFLNVGQPDMKIRTTIKDIIPLCGLVRDGGRAQLLIQFKWEEKFFDIPIVLREFSHGSSGNRHNEV